MEVAIIILVSKKKKKFSASFRFPLFFKKYNNHIYILLFVFSNTFFSHNNFIKTLSNFSFSSSLFFTFSFVNS